MLGLKKVKIGSNGPGEAAPDLLQYNITTFTKGGKPMKTQIRQTVLDDKLGKEFAWISQEFSDFHTLADLELENVDKFVAFHLGLSL